jgi:multiple sugar transport system permease protein
MSNPTADKPAPFRHGARPLQRSARRALLPYLVGTLLLTLLPALVTFFFAFTEYNAIRPPVWVGFGNFRRLFDAPVIRLGLRNTALFVGLAVPVRVLVALGAALLLQRERRGVGIFRAAVYVPTLIPEAAYALIWLWVLNPVFGPLNGVLQALGLAPVPWLVEPTTARVGLVIMAAFQIGEGFVILLAGLQSVAPAVYEAAQVDGAGRWTRFWHITLPLLVPWLLLLTFRDLLVSLQNTFTPSFVMTYGGPYYATTQLPLLLYELAFDYFDFGLAAAVLVLFYLAIMVFVAAALLVIRVRLNPEAT